MVNPPVFVEVLPNSTQSNVQICFKVACELFKRQVLPLPFASTVREVKDVLANMKTRNSAPGIVVINTLWAEEVMDQLPALIDRLPVLFLVRQVSTETVILAPGAKTAAASKTYAIMDKMPSPHKCIWMYGSQTADKVATKAADAIALYLRYGNYNAISKSADVAFPPVRA